ncbi:MAG: hypothetical protein ACLPKB_09610 [Xanthobacteraceae bacterium]
MAKKTSKRREWTKDDIRELKAPARQKSPAGKVGRILKPKKGPTSVSLSEIRRAVRAVDDAT